MEQEVAIPLVEIEERRPFLKELALFRIEERVACQVDLLIVHLHLCEIGIHREVEYEIVGEAVLCIETQLIARVARIRIPQALSIGPRRPAHPRQRVRRYVQRFARVDPPKHYILGNGGFPKRELRRDGRERDPFVLPGDQPRHRKSHHDSSVHFLKTQAGERDTHFSKPPLLRHNRGRVPKGVPTLICRHFIIAGDREVTPDSSGGRHKPERVFIVVKRIKIQREGIIPIPSITIERIDPDPGRIAIVEPARSIDVLVVIGYADLGAFGGLAFEHREIHGHRQGGNSLPRQFIAQAIELHHAIDSLEVHRSPFLCTGSYHGAHQQENNHEGLHKEPWVLR